jgi:phospholipid/cholesterol/gamma-HCH transport system substrate-binding protein
MLMKASSPRPARVAQAVLLRTYGLVFLLVLALLVGLSIAIYNKAFVHVVTVTLETDRVGNQLAPPADVKLRGMIVGEVRNVRSDGRTASVELALDPVSVPLIPSNVSARLLPKTLFGEKYVALQLPSEPSREAIGEGDVIPQDRSRTAIEIETVLDNLLPLLRTIKPAKLNATLNAFATALEGRGERIGENLELVDGYFGRFNQHLPALTDDITGLADLSQIYADAAPDLARMLRNFTTSSRTMADKAATYAAFLTGTTGFATTTGDFLAANDDRIIRVNSVGRPTMELLARYSPQYPCLLQGLSQSNDFIGDAFAHGELHITLEVVRSRPGYKPGEEPRWGENRGPRCYGLPNPPTPWPGNVFNDGTNPAATGGGGSPLDALTSGHSGTAEEQRVVDALVAPALGVPATQVPDVATLLFAPMARGTAVRHS